jgi:putative Mn2+ efflux pump MntP
MDFIILLFIAISLAMDCLAVSLAVGTSKIIPRIQTAGILGFVFGGFQFGMNVIGWAAGSPLIAFIAGFDHWIAFILLTVIGGRMILEGLVIPEKKIQVLHPATLLFLAVATSIDSLGVGLSFALLRTEILVSALIIGAVSASFSFMGVMVGGRLAEKYGEGFEIVGGIILIGIGIQILYEHGIG